MRRFPLIRTTAALFALLIRRARPDCADLRNALQEHADAYIYSLITGAISPLFATTAYTQNNAPTSLTSKSSIFTTAPLNIAHHRTTIDPDACATYTELVALAPDPGFLIGTQIHFLPSPAGNASLTPTLLDSIVTTAGDLHFNASAALPILQAENWEPLAPRLRINKEGLRGVVDAYLDLWGVDGGTRERVPWGRPCRALIGGGVYTGNGSVNDSCDVGIPAPPQRPVTKRRYVIDEEVGSASVLCEFGAVGGGAPDCHEIRVEGGRLRWVHGMTVMRGR